MKPAIHHRSVQLVMGICLILPVSFLCSCTISSRLMVNEDPYLQQSTVKLRQNIRAYSDERFQIFSDRRDYEVSFSYYTIKKTGEIPVSYVSVGISTGVRADKIGHECFINTMDTVFRINATDYYEKLYTSSSTSTSSSISRTEKNKDKESDDASQDEKEISTTVTTTTETNQSTYQFMQADFMLDPALLKAVSEAEKIKYRIYIGREGLDATVMGFELKRLQTFALNSL